uniref:Uncharacterized protein n=1 Tax=Arundo donax TaxID=35708 RepID=A0A0A9H0L4_ARUDO
MMKWGLMIMLHHCLQTLRSLSRALMGSLRSISSMTSGGSFVAGFSTECIAVCSSLAIANTFP